MAKRAIPEDRILGIIDDDVFIDVKSFEYYRKLGRNNYWHKIGYDGLILGLGKSVFIFDIESCDYKEKGETNGKT